MTVPGPPVHEDPDAAPGAAPPLARSEDISRRRRVYTIQMAVRMACFLALPFLPGWWKLAALVGALVLPYVAVLMANDPDLEGGLEAPWRETAAAPVLAAPPSAPVGPPTIRIGPDGAVVEVAVDADPRTDADPPPSPSSPRAQDRDHDTGTGSGRSASARPGGDGSGHR